MILEQSQFDLIIEGSVQTLIPSLVCIKRFGKIAKKQLLFVPIFQMRSIAPSLI